MTEDEAILLVQTHERARQGEYLKAPGTVYKTNETKKGEIKIPSQATSDSYVDSNTCGLSAALRIQKHWRGFITRRITRRNKVQEMILLGMIPTVKFRSDDMDIDSLNRERRLNLRKQREMEYEHAILAVRNKLEKQQRSVILEQLSDQVRTWMHEYKDHTGKFPDATGSERATSRLLLSRQGTDSEISKSTQLSSKESKSKKDDSSKSKTNQPDKVVDDLSQTKILTSMFLPELNAQIEEFNEIWRNMDEVVNPFQKHYEDIIINEEITHLESSLRKVVNEMMKVELQLLQDALDRDRGFKTKKRSSKKLKRSGKKSKKKKEKDLTPDRTQESLFEELFANGIIKRYPEVNMREFEGERSYNTAPTFSSPENPSNSIRRYKAIVKGILHNPTSLAAIASSITCNKIRFIGWT
ncbi:hypothetical protein WA026_020069 [Henosepilachna vigintioctopunctata]|uniref:Uncharacterized protein n=1 Tax=Henosepilachna vigintioctopunctata TaxID=420089 RepID=A0AAW1UAV0_9CUCU